MPASVIETGAEGEGGEDVPFDVDVAEYVRLTRHQVTRRQEHDPQRRLVGEDEGGCCVFRSPRFARPRSDGRRWSVGQRDECVVHISIEPEYLVFHGGNTTD